MMHSLHRPLSGKIFSLALSLFFLPLFTGRLFAQPDELVIKLGKGDELVYRLKEGLYSINWHGEAAVKDAYAQASAGGAAGLIDSRSAGAASWKAEQVSTGLGKATLYTISFAGDKRLQQLFYVIEGRHELIMQVRLNAGTASSDYMAPLIAQTASLSQAGDNRALYVPFDNDMWARYNATALAGADFRSSEVTALYNADNRKGIVTGSLEQDIWKTGVSVKGKTATELSEMKLFAGFSDSVVTHDRIPHGKVLPVQGSVCSPMMMIGFYDDWRAGMETFAQLDATLHPRVIFSWDRPTPMGWNSWGVLREKLSYDQAIGVVDFFADSCSAFRTEDHTLFIDLDAFWDNMTPGGLDGDVSKLQAFVAHCKQKGFKPGIYWTPFADWGKWDHPIEGASGYTYAQVWTTQGGRMLDIDGGRAMDPTHPATQQRIVHVIEKMKQLGFEMIKVDFLGHGALEADKFYAPGVTTGMQAFNAGMQFLDSVLKGSMLVYAAISPSLATSRYVHVRRIACDAFSTMEHTEYTMNSTGYGWWQSLLYNYMDADHVVFAGEADGVNRARMAAALVTGTLITGDDFSSPGKWKTTGRRLLQNQDLLQVIHDGKSFRPLQTNTGDKGVGAFIKTGRKQVYLAYFNYSGSPLSIQLSPSLPGGGRKKRKQAKALFSGRMVRVSDEVVIPPFDVEIYRVR